MVSYEDFELKKYYAEHNLPKSAIQYIEESIPAPSRNVGESAKGNVCTGFVSEKTGCSQPNESRVVENSFAIEFEYSKYVWKAYSQPSEVMVDMIQKNGNIRSKIYYPDCLVFYFTGPSVLEMKTEEEAKKLVESDPKNWIYENGEYFFVPAIKRFRQIGIEFKVKTSAELNPVRIENLRHLIYARQSNYVLSDSLRAKIHSLFQKNSVMTMLEVTEELGDQSLTPLFLMVENGELFVDLNRGLMTCPESTLISPVEEMLVIAQRAMTNEMSSHDLAINDIKFRLNEIPDLASANRALDRLDRVNSGERNSSVRRYKLKIRQGLEKGLSPVEALLDNTHLKGNRSSKIPTPVLNYLKKYIGEYHATPSRPIKSTSFRLYKNKANKEHPLHKPVGKNTFLRHIKLYDQVDLGKGRGGRRFANAAKEPTPPMKREIRGTTPFSFATMDHYLADIFLILAIANGKIYAFRPWLSVMVDICTNAILAWWLAFRAPSCRTCAMMIRQCARAYGKLPNEILVDHGSEFDSVFYKTLLAAKFVNDVKRPQEDPKFGSEAERIFGVIKTKLLSQLPGNTVEYVENRSVSSSHSSMKSARITIEHFVELFQQYVDWQDDCLIGDRYKSANVALREGIEKFGFVGRKANVDEKFIIDTAVDVRNYTVDPTRGLNIDGRHYWNPELKWLAARKKPASTRLEPENPYIVYSKVNDKWLTCVSGREQKFMMLSPSKQIAESIRVNDGRQFREEIKEESNQILVELIVNHDKIEVDKNELYLPSSIQPASIATNNDSLFKVDESADGLLDLDSLSVDSWN